MTAPPLTRFCHGLNGNVLFVGHESEHGEDGKACHEAGAAVEAAQHDAVPYGRHGREKEGEKEHRTYCELWTNATPEAWRASVHMLCKDRKLSGAASAAEATFSKTAQLNSSGWESEPRSFLSSPVAVVVIGVVAPQSGEAAQADGIREEDLSSSVHPHLQEAHGHTGQDKTALIPSAENRFRQSFSPSKP